MKAWWKIYDKPRGRWRPRMDWGIHFSPKEMEEAESLAVNREISYCIRGIETGAGAGRVTLPKCSNAVLLFAERPYKKNAKGVGVKDDYLLGSVHSVCNDCPIGETLKGSERNWASQGSLTLPNTWWAVRLPWRPGARPDYSDFIEPVRFFLHRVLEELERRFQEARESAPSDEWLLEEEFDSFSWEVKSEKTESKLRVIRR